MEPYLAFWTKAMGKVVINELENYYEFPPEPDVYALNVKLLYGQGWFSEINEYRCYNCGKKGHAYRECKAQKSQGLSCYKCGTKESVLADCINRLKDRLASFEMRLSETDQREETTMPDWEIRGI